MAGAASPPLNGEMASKLAELERLCEAKYGAGSDQSTRENALLALRPFETSADHIPHCQLILDNSSNQYALLLAAQSLGRLATKHWNSFAPKQRIGMRNYVLGYLASRLATLPNFVRTHLVIVPCRIAKLGWNDAGGEHRDIVDQVTKFLQASLQHCVVGLEILRELVDQMNKPLLGQTMTNHRKVAVSFRDTSLLKVFQIALNSLKQIAQNQINADPTTKAALQRTALELACRCLHFDYIGTNPDESSEDFGSLQIPSAWRSTIEDPNTVSLFFTLAAMSGEASAQSLETLVQLASARRSLFSSEEARAKYLAALTEKTLDILQNRAAMLQDTGSYLHFCRLLVSIKSNYQLADLVQVPCYGEWIRAVADFTLTSFRSWGWTTSANHYLVALWARLTLSIPYMRGGFQTYLDELVPQVARTFVETRLDKIAQQAQEDPDDDLEELLDFNDLEEQLRHLPTLCRYKFTETFAWLSQRWDALAQQYQQLVQQVGNSQVRVVEAQLTWLAYVFGAIVSGNPASSTSKEDQLRIDAGLCARVFSTIPLVESRLQTRNPAPSKGLDRAILYFMQMFRRSHIGYNGMTRSVHMMSNSQPQIYTLLAAELNQASLDQCGVLTMMVQKVVSNLRMWSGCATVVRSSLELLTELSAGYSSSKLLVTLDAAKQILAQHGPQHFPFMQRQEHFKDRTQFYSVLAKVAFAEPNIDSFDEFMAPFEQAFQSLEQLQMSQGDANTALAIGIGLARDLRGVVKSISGRQAYQLFFEWCYPRYLKVIVRIFETYWRDSRVAVPMLRFLSELVHNKAQRVTFPSCSPNGIILFKEAAKVLSTYGNRLLLVNKESIDALTPHDLYKQRFKGISLCMQILARSLSGGYCNFGVFTLYNDKSLDEALSVVIKLVLSIPMGDLLSYKKICTSYYTLMEVLFRSHASTLIALNQDTFVALLATLLEGIQNPDANVASLSASAIDHLCSWRHSQGKKRADRRQQPQFDQLQAHLQRSQGILGQMLTTLYTQVLFENVPNQWSLSRPIFSIMISERQEFQRFQQWFLSTQPGQNHAALQTAFSELMQDIQPKMDTANREKFTQRLTTFKNTVKKFATRPPEF